MGIKIACIPDLHLPFMDQRCLPLAVFKIIEFKPNIVIQLGDLYDRYSAAKFPRSFNVLTPREERKWARYYAEIFWAVLVQNLPNAKMYQLIGNHDVRPLKRVLEKMPEAEEEIYQTFQEDYKFDHVETIFDSRQELIIDDILFTHGYFTKIGDHAKFNNRSVVHGHTHRAGVWYQPKNGHHSNQIWELDCGHLANPFARALAYTAQKRATNWSHGFGLIDDDGPRFVGLNPNLVTDFKDNPLFDELLNQFRAIIFP